MSIEIINHNLDGEENDFSFSTEIREKTSQHINNLAHNPLKKTISEVPADSNELITVPVSSQLKTIKSHANKDSHISVNNRVDQSSLNFTSVNRSEELTKTKPIKEFKKITYNNESYEGSLVLNNLHGHGFLSTEKNGQKLFYDGLFYVNKLEGYSQIFYENGTHFQGLFKQHKRYGPGVLTYSNGTQDVGFWNGFSLIRLASVVGSDVVPKLVSTASGQTQLLCHKYLLPLCEVTDNYSSELFGNIEENSEYFNNVMNMSIRNPNSCFFHRRLYDELFFGEQDCNIKVAIDENAPEELLEEEDDESIRDSYQQTIQMMKEKIKELSDKLMSFVAIKQSLLERIRYCTECCEKNESIEFSEEVILSETKIPAPVSEKEESDYGSLKPDVSIYDPSLPSDDIYEADNEETVNQASEKSLKQTILQFCDCCEEQQVDDLQYLEDQLSNILKQDTFYGNIKNNLQKKLENLMENEKIHEKSFHPKYKTVKVTEVWAWNNEKCLMEIQKHCFKHRNFEYMVNFSVSNLISGQRKDFEAMGKHEELCTKFLKACSKGNKEFVRQCLRNSMNPNIADGRGNTGIFFAVAANQVQIIPILTNFGSKLDQINDEALTPLTLCILKYLSIKYKCHNWEKAFLPEIRTCSIANLPKWYEIESFLSLSSTSSRNSDSLDQMSSYNQNSRILELFRRLTNLKQKESSSTKNIVQTSYFFDLSCKYSVSPEKPVENHSSTEDIQNTLKQIHLTIMTLLDYGADPNIGEVPYPPLVMSLFSENPILVKQILDAKADVNVLVTDDKLSCHHVIASLNSSRDNIEICRLLIMYKCNPNMKALPSHWKESKSYFMGNIPDYFDCEDLGKNALHLLCMRTDFEQDDCDFFCVLCRTLIEAGLDCSETYLGHTALSLAVLAANLKLIKCLIRTNAFNPYDNLDYDMGNVMTLFSLKRFENILPLDKCKAVLTALFEADVNVLNRVGDVENAIAFAEEGDALFKLQNPEKEDKLHEKGKAKPKTKPSKIDKRSQCTLMTEFLKDLGRQTIIKQIQMIATEILYEFTEESVLETKEISIALAEFLNPQIVINNLKIIFRSENIDHERLNFDYIKELLEFVNLHKKVEKIKKKSKASKSPNNKKKNDIPEANRDEKSMDELIQTANFKKSAVHLPNHTNSILEPGFDDPEIYKVCYHCLRGKNKELKICPRCQVIRYCSVQCNKSSLKLKTRHTCNLVFWDMSEGEREEISKGECLTELAKIARENCLLRLHQKREARLVQEEQRLLEMWRADTYGTKFLELRPLLEKAASSKGSKNLSWNVEGLQKLLERNFEKNPADIDAYSIDALMAQLSSRQKMREASIMSSRKSARSTLTCLLESALAQQFAEPRKSIPICSCPKKVQAKHSRNETRHQKKQTNQTTKLNTLEPKTPKFAESTKGQFHDMHANARIHEANTVIKKLRKIPERYQRFIQIIGAYYPDIDLSFWLLPYACCSNGQLFYKFCDNDLFRESYSFS